MYHSEAGKSEERDVFFNHNIILYINVHYILFELFMIRFVNSTNPLLNVFYIMK